LEEAIKDKLKLKIVYDAVETRSRYINYNISSKYLEENEFLL